MAGICKYCGFAGTNDELADHAGEMCQGDHQPDIAEETLHIKQQPQDRHCSAVCSKSIGGVCMSKHYPCPEHK